MVMMTVMIVFRASSECDNKEQYCINPITRTPFLKNQRFREKWSLTTAV